MNVNARAKDPFVRPSSPKEKRVALAKVVAAERAVRGGRGKRFLEVTAFEVFDTLLGPEKASQRFFHGVKRTRQIGNLGVRILGPGLRCAAAVRRMMDTEFALHRDDVGLIIRGVRPAFSSYVVTRDLYAGPPHLAFVPRPS